MAGAPKITVIRLGHRLGRDARITTHCGLVARAFGASKIILTGEKDDHVLESIKKVAKRWGGKFEVEYEKNWKNAARPLRNNSSVIVHLTMYGINIPDAIDEIKNKIKSKDLVIIIGSEKVPSEIYHIADYNIAVGSTPHSEVSALAIFLDRIFEGKELEAIFENWDISIIPQRAGKKLIEKK